MNRAGCVLALFPMTMSSPAWPGVDKPWQDLDASSGGDSVFTGLVLLALGYAAWRLFVSGNLGSLISSIVRFLLAIYLPVALFLVVMVVASQLLQSGGMEKDTAGFLALLIAGAVAWGGMRLWSVRKVGAATRPPVKGDADD